MGGLCMLKRGEAMRQIGSLNLPEAQKFIFPLLVRAIHFDGLCQEYLLD